MPNVHEFPGHIACDSASNSELVIPLFIERNGKKEVVGVFDIDSLHFNGLDSEDAQCIEQIASLGKMCFEVQL